MTKNRNTPILLTLIAFIANTVSSTAHAYETIYSPNEASPEEIASEFAEQDGFSAPLQSAAGADSQMVQSADFGQYRLTVDIFRRSTKRPVLGRWTDDYVDPTNSTFTSKVEKTRLAQGKKRFATLAGLEFAVVSIDGVPVKAHIISGAREAEVNLPVRENGRDKLEIARDEVTGEVLLDPNTGRPVIRKVMKLAKKTTPSGAFVISPRYGWKVPYGMPAKSSKVKMPDPFPLSSAYELSTMYWGLEIKGISGYLIHSTPHYGELGRPASMGCIRQSYPDAMELFDMVTNQFDGVGMIRIHKMDSVAAYNRLRELVYDPSFEPVYTASQLADPATMPVYASSSAQRDMKWLVERLNNNYQNLKDFIRYNRSGEYEDYGHTWLNPVTKRPDEPTFPKCGAYDCFVEFGNPTKKRSEKVQKKREADAAIHEEETQRILQQSGF